MWPLGIITDPTARDTSTKFPLDGVTYHIYSISQEELLAYAKEAPILHSLGRTEIVRLSKALVMKSGPIRASEGDIMKYIVANFPDVRLPKVYRIFKIENFNSSLTAYTRIYIVMDHIEGRSLETCWNELGSNLQLNIINQVARMLDSLQKKHFDGSGAIGDGISAPSRIFSEYGAGPFTTKDEFERWNNWKLGLSMAFGHATQNQPVVSYSYFVLTHGDISSRNLILDPSNGVWMIDWGCAGIYPPIFETASITLQLHFPDFAEMPRPLVYNNDLEMNQLQSCQYAIHHMTFSVPPEDWTVGSSVKLYFAAKRAEIVVENGKAMKAKDSRLGGVVSGKRSVVKDGEGACLVRSSYQTWKRPELSTKLEFIYYLYIS